MRNMKFIVKQARAELRQKGFKPIWFFKSDCVHYGIAVKDGKVWSFTVSSAKASLHGRVVHGRVGMLGNYAPTKQYANGLNKAKDKLNID